MSATSAINSKLESPIATPFGVLKTSVLNGENKYFINRNTSAIHPSEIGKLIYPRKLSGRLE